MTCSAKQKTGPLLTSARERNSESKSVRFKNSDEVTLSDLREMSGLNHDVDKQLGSLGLQLDSSESECASEDESIEGSFELDLGADSEESKKSKKKSYKSGLYKKSADTVKFPQIWPHSALQFEYVSVRFFYVIGCHKICRRGN